jgi:hypothetical protein
MHSQDGTYTQITFHYLNGQSESFNIFEQIEDETAQGMQLEVRRLLEKEWWILNLPEQTVMINIANVAKVEVKPTLSRLHGEGIFEQAERITALNRAR